MSTQTTAGCNTTLESLADSNQMILKPIGVVRTPYQNSGDAPRQGRLSDAVCTLELLPEYMAGLKDLEKASHLIILYWCHRAGRDKLQTRTPYSETIKGVFATRSPSRPNPIAVCMAELLEVNGVRIKVQGVDALDGSPLLDIKPYSSGIDAIHDAWHELHKK